MKYDLQRLDPQAFADCVWHLSHKVAGKRPVGARRDITLADGADFYLLGRLDSTGSALNNPFAWDARTRVQVNYSKAPAEQARNRTPVWRRIYEFLERWSRFAKSGSSDQVIFVSNLPLTRRDIEAIELKIRKYIARASELAEEDAADKVRQQRAARAARLRQLKDWRIWDGHEVCKLLDAHQDVRRAFAGYLVAGDVLADLSRFSSAIRNTDLAQTLTSHARAALIGDRNIHFDDAGVQQGGFPVDEVIIDLPIIEAGSSRHLRAAHLALSQSEEILHPRFTQVQKPRHLVITGAPGNGKTTITRFIVHAARAAWLGENANLGEEHRHAVDAASKALSRLNIPPVRHRRWPFRVDLAEFASRRATDDSYTLLSWLAHTLSTYADEPPKAWALRSFLKDWPTLVVLDGLDEVTEPTVRKALITEIESFAADAETEEFDVFLIVTTRPTGYLGELSASLFRRIDLVDLSLDEALEYGRAVTRVRVAEPERQQAIEALLEQATREEALRNLMRTPLQVLIMTVIAETARHFVPHRYGLFWKYYETVLSREQSKQVSASGLIRDNASLILDLHQRIGLTLQVQAETTQGADASLNDQELRDLAWHVLNDADYEPSTTDARMLQEIVRAATHRLVLIAPLPDGGYGFDVRSLQELMAARSLTTGPLDDVTDRLREIAASPHWRNTLLFSCGRFFAEPQPVPQQAMTDLILTIDENAAHRLGRVVPIGPILAMEIVDDGMLSGHPRWLYPVLGHALTAIGGPEPDDLPRFARMLLRASRITSRAREIIVDRIRAGLGGPHWERVWTTELQDAISSLTNVTRDDLQSASLAAIKRDPSKTAPAEPRANWEAADDALETYEDRVDPELLQRLRSLLSDLTEPELWADELLGLLQNPLLAEAAEDALSHIALAEPERLGRLPFEVMPTLWRRPVESFRSATTPTTTV